MDHQKILRQKNNFNPGPLGPEFIHIDEIQTHHTKFCGPTSKEGLAVDLKVVIFEKNTLLKKKMTSLKSHSSTSF